VQFWFRNRLNGYGSNNLIVQVNGVTVRESPEWRCTAARAAAGEPAQPCLTLVYGLRVDAGLCSAAPSSYPLGCLLIPLTGVHYERALHGRDLVLRHDEALGRDGIDSHSCLPHNLAPCRRQASTSCCFRS
jgi:hypothetical protein